MKEYAIECKYKAIQYTGKNYKEIMYFIGDEDICFIQNNKLKCEVEDNQIGFYGYHSIEIGEYVGRDQRGNIFIYPEKVFLNIFKRRLE